MRIYDRLTELPGFRQDFLLSIVEYLGDFLDNICGVTGELGQTFREPVKG